MPRSFAFPCRGEGDFYPYTALGFSGRSHLDISL